MDTYSHLFYNYKITNKFNSKTYIGKANDYESRWLGHIKAANEGSTDLIHRAIRKYGPENFLFEIIFITFSEEEAYQFEKHFIQDYDCCIFDGKHKGYNMNRGGRGFDSDWSKKIQKSHIDDGTHHFLGSKVNNERVSAGTHNFLGGEIQSKAHARRLAEGDHQCIAIQTCPHCGHTGVGIAMKRWHFDRCKARELPDLSVYQCSL